MNIRNLLIVGIVVQTIKTEVTPQAIHRHQTVTYVLDVRWLKFVDRSCLKVQPRAKYVAGDRVHAK